ncbi:MAG: elongation factor 4 [Candidatus Pacebacteria bacterium]|nr:elongation factor 4 [Candidatus Paceibacterota bacterium]
MTKNIRNFCIIAHINHGKSTLADRLLELTGTVAPEKMRSQFLASHPIERERGITIRLAPVKMNYAVNSRTYILNLIDTPGHVDFSYEVSRSLAACEGAILVVDAVSGVQAQTVANLSLARKQNLAIIPVINKIDIEAAQPEEVASELAGAFGFSEKEILFVSAKTGENTGAILEAVIKKIPPPSGSTTNAFQGLVFNSTYDSHKGVIAWVRIKQGKLSLLGQNRKETRVKFLATGVQGVVGELGFFTPQMSRGDSLDCGDVGYLCAGIKDLALCRVGDTVVSADQSGVGVLTGYQPARPTVFTSFYPTENQDFYLLKESLEKLKLSDSALTFSPESSQGLGKGFRIGFLGLLHAEVVADRLRRDFEIDLVMTAPMVSYQVRKRNDEIVRVNRPADFPAANQISEVLEPIVSLKIFSPFQYVTGLISLVKEKRGSLIKQDYFGRQASLVFQLPLAEMIADLYDRVKSLSSGFASFDWELVGYEPVRAVKLEVFLNQQPVDAFSQIVPQNQAQNKGRRIVEKLRKLIPRQQYEVIIRAQVGTRVIARETLKPFRKDVTAKLYGGDQTRKDKLLGKQKKGKKKLKMVGRVSIPQEVFWQALGGREN